MRMLSVCRLARAALPAVLLLSGFGCGGRSPAPARLSASEEKAAAEQRTVAEINKVFAQANEAFAAGRTNEALASVDAALRNPDFAACRPQIFDAQLRILLHIGRTGEARQRALAASSDPLLAACACGVLYRHYHETGDTAGALAWTEALTANPTLAPDLRPQVFFWSVGDRIALHQDDQAVAALGKALPALKPAEGFALTRQVIEAFFNAGRPEKVEQTLALAAGLKVGAMEIRRLTVVTQMRVAAVRGNWAALPRDLSAAAGVLTDGELDGALRAVTSAAVHAGHREQVDPCLEAILFCPAAASNRTAMATAARIWGENAMETDRGSFPRRIDALLHIRGVPATTIVTLFLSHYYDFIDQPVPLRQLIELGDRLTPLADSEEIRNDIRSKMLDGCFLVQDYDRALTLAEARIPGPGRDEQWHVAAITKIKAHRALLRKEPREAVKYFREFMDFLRTAKMSGVPDPTSGRVYPTEMILGRNAKRIGDILAGIPAPAEAGKAYAEAREFFAQARKYAKEPDIIAAIDAEAAQVPKTR